MGGWWVDETSVVWGGREVVGVELELVVEVRGGGSQRRGGSGWGYVLWRERLEVE